MNFRRRSRDQRGAAAVEFALILPIFLLLLFGIIDFGYAINRGSIINNAARDAAREGSLSQSKSQIEATANAGLTQVSGATVAVTCRKKPSTAGGTGANCGDYDTDKEMGGSSIVTITYQHQLLTPVGIFFSGGLNLSRTAEMRIES